MFSLWVWWSAEPLAFAGYCVSVVLLLHRRGFLRYTRRSSSRPH